MAARSRATTSASEVSETSDPRGFFDVRVTDATSSGTGDTWGAAEDASNVAACLQVAELNKSRKDKQNLREKQADAVTRFVSRCASQRGFLGWHTMGSGKTAIGVAFMANFRRFKKIIVTPDGIDVPWKTDIKDFWLSPSLQCEPQAIEFLTYTQMAALPLTSLDALFADAVVVMDEAHKIVPYLRNETTRTNVRQALKKCHRVLLLTGTPMQEGWGDLGVLINIIAGKPVLPGITDDFEAKFARSAEWGAFMRGFVVVFDNVMELFSSASFATSLSAIALAPLGLATLGTSLAVASTACTLYALNALTWQSWIHKSREVNAKTIAEALVPYVSFFDYSFYPASDKRLEAYPAMYEGRPQQHAVPMDEMQLRLLQRQCRPQRLASDSELIAFGDVDVDEIDGGADFRVDWTDASRKSNFSPAEFALRMRALGNLSSSALCCVPKRKAFVPFRPRADMPLVLAYAKNRVYEHAEFKTGQLSANARATLEDYVQKGMAEEDGKKTREQVLATNVFCTAKFDKALELCLAARSQSHFLPVVYSNFDKNGIQLFSAYLTAKNLPHIVVHPEDAADVRGKLVEIANWPHRLYARSPDGTIRVVLANESETSPEELFTATMQNITNTPNEQRVQAQLIQLQEIMTRASIVLTDRTADLAARATAKKSKEQAEKQAAEIQFQEDLKKAELLRDLRNAKKPPEDASPFTLAVDNLQLHYSQLTLLTKESGLTKTHLVSYADLCAQRALRSRLPFLLRFLAGEGSAAPQVNGRPWDSTRDEVPFCVLLHPDIREGIGFDLAPSMVCLEVPNGVGNRDQIYARVLRSLNPSKRTLAFVDGTFVPGELALAPGATASSSSEAESTGFWNLFKARKAASTALPWRVVKDIHQLMLGFGVQEFAVPAFFAQWGAPRFISYPDFFTIVRDVDSYVVDDKSEADRISQWYKLAETAGSQDVTGLRKLAALLYNFAPTAQKANLGGKGLTQEQRRKQMGIQGQREGMWWVLNQTAFVKVPDISKMATFALRLTPRFLQLMPTYAKEVSEGRFHESYTKFLKQVTNTPLLTGDEATFQKNIGDAEILEAIRIELNKLDDKTAACVVREEDPAARCVPWVPDEFSKQDTTAQQQNSCTTKQEQLLTAEQRARLGSVGQVGQAARQAARQAVQQRPPIEETKAAIIEALRRPSVYPAPVPPAPVFFPLPLPVPRPQAQLQAQLQVQQALAAGESRQTRAQKQAQTQKQTQTQTKIRRSLKRSPMRSLKRAPKRTSKDSQKRSPKRSQRSPKRSQRSPKRTQKRSP